jgi:hypothetical protein
MIRSSRIARYDRIMSGDSSIRASALPQEPMRQDMGEDIVTEAEYEALYATLSATARGRMFLAQFAQRSRHADTNMLLAAVNRLEQSLATRQTDSQTSGGEDSERDARLRREWDGLAAAIARARRDFARAHFGPPDREDRMISDTLAWLTHAAQARAGAIDQSAERIQSVAWTLREQGIDFRHCDQVDQQARDIRNACADQDEAAQSIAIAITLLREIEITLAAMSGAPAETPHEPIAALPPQPSALAESETPQPTTNDEPQSVPEQPSDPLAPLRALTPNETIALFS